ncbi:radical SAM protein [Candidatus Bathyarchaeota archaeon]|nr:radical SAM protein [Candidatus Bathyarchaeota archaeon]
MKVLLVNPPSLESSLLADVSVPRLPWSLAYLAGVLEQGGHDVQILDLYPIHDPQEVKQRILGCKSSLVGITATTPYIHSAYHLARMFKTSHPETIIVLGGWHPSALPERTLEECPSIDIIVRGEGEMTLLELCNSIDSHGMDTSTLSRILGLTFKSKEGGIESTPARPLIQDLDTLPFPAVHLLPMDEYPEDMSNLGAVFSKDDKFSLLITSRGCPFNCLFCADGLMYRQTTRYRSIENVIEEIKFMKKHYGINFFGIIDPDFLQKPERVYLFCRTLIKEHIKIKWGCQARVDTIPPGLLRLMKATGCYRIYYGVESGSPRILKKINKRIKLSQAHKVIQMTKEAGILVIINMMLGLPGEREEDIVASWKLIKDLSPDNVYLNLTKPLPGSELFDRYFQALPESEKKRITWSDFYFTVEYVESRDFSFRNLPLEKIRHFQRLIMIDYYFSISFLKKVLLDLKSFRHFKFYVRAFLAMLYAILTRG